MMRNYFLPVLLLVTASYVAITLTQDIKVACTSCTTYSVTIGNSTNTTTGSCPAGTVCAVTTNTTNLCDKNNLCDGVKCDRYAVFPSSASCQQYHVCRYNLGLNTFIVSTYMCPGASLFDMTTGKCTLNTPHCYNATSSG